MEIKKGGIYLYEPPKPPASGQQTPFLTSGSEQSGCRPWVIVSRDLISRRNQFKIAVGVPLTTKVHKANSHRILVPASEMAGEIGSSYAFQDSVALCDHVRVLDCAQIIRKVGTMSGTAVGGIELGLAFVFDIR